MEHRDWLPRQFGARAATPPRRATSSATTAPTSSWHWSTSCLLDRLRRELGLAIVFVSHDLGVVRLLCERVLVMHEGCIVDQGPAHALFDQPRHSCTAALAATIPRFPGE